METHTPKTGAGLRRTERIMLEIPIRVFSFGGSAGDFSEDTRTLMVNRDGALIVLKRRVAPNQIVRIINLENFREDDFRVVGLSRQEGDRFAEWGVECLDKNRTLWEIDFPPPLADQTTEGGALLQCSGCGKESFLVLSLTEVNMLDSSGAIEKLCEKCGELTPWVYGAEVRVAGRIGAPGEIQHDAPAAVTPPREAEEEREGIQPPLLESPPPAVLPQKWDRKTERRIFRRLTLKLPVLVRNQVGETELGRTENVSKGGIGVGLGLMLALGAHLTVVCPYSGAGNQIEQKAEVRRRLSLYGGRKWLYGLRYLLE
ncbi:MAG TPA: PilZ domain-containing protein [Terriglobia bacterium]|nr:PilZ domain-containing protein [Terriglobia bacterium]